MVFEFFAMKMDWVVTCETNPVCVPVSVPRGMSAIVATVHNFNPARGMVTRPLYIQCTGLQALGVGMGIAASPWGCHRRRTARRALSLSAAATAPTKENGVSHENRHPWPKTNGVAIECMCRC